MKLICPICGEAMKNIPMSLEIGTTDNYLVRFDGDTSCVKELLHRNTESNILSLKMVCNLCETNVTDYLSDEAVKEATELIMNFIYKKGEDDVY